MLQVYIFAIFHYNNKYWVHQCINFDIDSNLCFPRVVVFIRFGNADVNSPAIVRWRTVPILLFLTGEDVRHIFLCREPWSAINKKPQTANIVYCNQCCITFLKIT